MRSFFVFIIIAGLIFPIRPHTVRVLIDPPQTVITNLPALAVHTRLTDEVEAWKIKKTVQMVREMGASHIVELFAWAHIEPSAGRYDWTHSDLVVAHARSQGLTIIARLGLVPAWARPENSTPNTLPLTSDAFFAQFAEQFSRRYANDITQIIVWNEPNLAFEWGGELPPPKRYVDLLRAVFPALNRGNPHVQLLAGALAPTVEPVGSPVGLNDLLYLQEMYRLGGAEFFDVLAVHAYGFSAPPDEMPSPRKLNFRRFELSRQIMARFDDLNTPMAITESGYHDDPTWPNGVSGAEKVDYTLAMLRLFGPTTPLIALWHFRTPAPTGDYNDYFALVGADFTPSPLYRAIQTATQQSTNIEENAP